MRGIKHLHFYILTYTLVTELWLVVYCSGNLKNHDINQLLPFFFFNNIGFFELFRNSLAGTKLLRPSGVGG